jgi:hypothetical protein
VYADCTVPKSTFCESSCALTLAAASRTCVSSWPDRMLPRSALVATPIIARISVTMPTTAAISRVCRLHCGRRRTFFGAGAALTAEL